VRHDGVSVREARPETSHTRSPRQGEGGAGRRPATSQTVRVRCGLAGHPVIPNDPHSGSLDGNGPVIGLARANRRPSRAGWLPFRNEIATAAGVPPGGRCRTQRGRRKIGSCGREHLTFGHVRPNPLAHTRRSDRLPPPKQLFFPYHKHRRRLSRVLQSTAPRCSVGTPTALQYH